MMILEINGREIMQNKDMPAMPQSLAISAGGIMYGTSEHDGCAGGLTKLEHFAGLAMQGLITLKGSDCQDADITARQCVRMAKALLAELEKGNE